MSCVGFSCPESLCSLTILQTVFGLDFSLQPALFLMGSASGVTREAFNLLFNFVNREGVIQVTDARVEFPHDLRNFTN